MGITFVTSNPVKAKQLGWHIKHPISHKKLELPEIQSLDLDEVVVRKAKDAYEHIASPVLVEDFSLTIHALGGLPGPLIKWFWEEIGTEGVCRILDGYADRSATATVAFCLYDGKDIRIYKGEEIGSISEHPRGKQVFGSDAIFIPKGSVRTWSELDQESKTDISIRGKALSRLERDIQRGAWSDSGN